MKKRKILKVIQQGEKIIREWPGSEKEEKEKVEKTFNQDIEKIRFITNKLKKYTEVVKQPEKEEEEKSLFLQVSEFNRNLEKITLLDLFY